MSIFQCLSVTFARKDNLLRIARLVGLFELKKNERSTVPISEFLIIMLQWITLDATKVKKKCRRKEDDNNILSSA